MRVPFNVVLNGEANVWVAINALQDDVIYTVEEISFVFILRM